MHDDKHARAHYDKYEDMARRIGIDRIVPVIPFCRERIREALENGDEHLNSFGLKRWDQAVGYSQFEYGWIEPCPCCGVKRTVKWDARKFRNLEPFQAGPHSAAERVCLLKHVARYHYAYEEEDNE